MSDVVILLPTEAADRIRDSGPWGRLTLRFSTAELAGYVAAVSQGDGTKLPATITPKHHFLHSEDSRPTGYHYRVRPDLHALWMPLARRRHVLTTAAFADYVISGFKQPGGGRYFAITYAPEAAAAFPDVPIPSIAAWNVTAEGVYPADIEVEPPSVGIAQLAGRWPIDLLMTKTVMVVGTGSIGGAAAVALATYGVGKLILVDPGRLRWHNLVRHVCGSAHIGRMKVSALGKDITALRPDTLVEGHGLDVVADADLIRPMLEETDLVLCAADGVAPRRVVSHLARRAQLPAVLACVLEDGGLGEVIRLRPWADRGCLLCQRDAHAAIGGIDPEPAIDAGYGTGTRHRPMTAVGGDLHAVGQLGAKIGVATILERHGHADQRLPGEHCLVGLRPRPGWAAPYDLTRAGEVTWMPANPPIPGCPTCDGP
jgi:hypothetical protein